MFRTKDGGKTFRSIGDMHGDHHALWIDPDNAKFLVNGNDGSAAYKLDADIYTGPDGTYQQRPKRKFKHNRRG